VLEQAAIAALVRTHHVIAGGGGGVPLASAGSTRQAQPAVVDKDWVAALLAIRLSASRLVFVTDVAHAYDDFGHPAQEAIARMDVGEARARLGRGVFAPGSMAPKVESALDFVTATGRPAVITTVGAVAAALAGAAGTEIWP
jgi:carbamate kinase